jgi:excisionase family DNA binding protein
LDLQELRTATKATISVEEAAKVLGISRGSAYRAARNGSLPILRLGARMLVPVPRLLQILGAESQVEP